MIIRRALPGTAWPTPHMPLVSLELFYPSAPRNQQCSHDTGLNAGLVPTFVPAAGIVIYMHAIGFELRRQSPASADTKGSELFGSLLPPSDIRPQTSDLRHPTSDIRPLTSDL